METRLGPDRPQTAGYDPGPSGYELSQNEDPRSDWSGSGETKCKKGGTQLQLVMSLL
jgi:hypothetical protein